MRILLVEYSLIYKTGRMKKHKMNFDELANQAKQLNKDEQLKVVGGRKGRGGISTWAWDRGGIIEDDLVIRFTDMNSKIG